jgi:hypothetical protein
MKNLKDLKISSTKWPLENGKTLQQRDYLFRPNINPYLIYITLKDLFGKPNGTFDEDKSQWNWEFIYRDFFIEIYEWKLYSTSIGIYHLHSNENESKDLAIKINSLLEIETLKRKSRTKAAIAKASDRILENTFLIYYTNATNLLEIAEYLDSSFNEAWRNPSKKRGEKKKFEILADLWFKRNDLYRSAFLMFLSSFEGFLNIYYELYLKHELRSERITDKISREQVDVKLRMLPVYCNGFNVTLINHEDERFKAYLRLVNLRNDFIHANLTKSSESYFIEEDNISFILEHEENREIPSNISKLSLEHIKIAKLTIDNILNLVFESMKSNSKKKFKEIMSEETISIVHKREVS